jgi:hypothetical protein
VGGGAVVGGILGGVLMGRPGGAAAGAIIGGATGAAANIDKLPELLNAGLAVRAAQPMK